MAHGSRKLCELLQEQQEPFLLRRGADRDAAQPCCSAAGRRSAWGRRAVRRALRRWDDLAGCFPCAARQSFFRRMPRAGDTGGSHCGGVEEESDTDDGGRRLSPVSVLDVLRCYSDDESYCSAALSHWEEEEDDLPSSTSGSSTPPNLRNDLLTGAATYPCYSADGRTDTRGAEATPMAMGIGKQKKFTEAEEQRIISSWERIASDIARVPTLAELDVSSSVLALEWRRFGVREAAHVGASIEAMIFEEVRAEAVCDLLTLHA